MGRQNDGLIANKNKCQYPDCAYRQIAFGYCHNHYKRYEKVRDVLNGKAPEDQMRPQDYHCVYAIGTLEHPAVKVGKSSQVVKRKMSIQGGNPHELFIFGAVYSHRDIIDALEFEVQKVLKEMGLHVRGEWFDISPLDAIAVTLKCARIHNLPVYEASDHHALCVPGDYRKAKHNDEAARLGVIKEIGDAVRRYSQLVDFS